MKTILKKSILINLIALLFILLIQPTNTYAATVKSVVTRNDGTWLFPLAQGSWFRLSDWAGCSANCVFGCSHANWGDTAHTDPRGHFGLDVGCGNIPVLASAAGKAYTGYCSGRGNYIVIEHPLNNGYSYYSVYQHLQSFSVGNGASVSTGQQIGIAGATGMSDGVHLHFEILLLESGLGSSLTNTVTLDKREGSGWLRYESGTNGLLVTNPSTANYTSATTCNFNNLFLFESIPYHCGSVTYTYKTSDVKIGKPVTNTVTATATLDQASNWFSTKEGVYGTDMDNDGICSDRDFIKEYSSFIGLSKLNNTPAYYTNKNNPVPAGYTRIQNWTGADGFIPQIGDIAIWKDGPFGSEGHFGIVLAADGWNITKFLEIKTNGLQGKVAITTGSNDYSYFWGVLRPVFANKITKRAVFFKNIDGTLLKFQLVPNGSNATPPANPTYPNHTFTGWYDRNADVRDYTNITKDITLIAQYRLNTSTQTVTKPSAITTLKATLYGYDDIKLTWNKTSDTTKYAIYYKKNSETSYKYWKSVTTTYVNAPNLADGVKYTFKVVPCRVYNSKNYYGTGKTVSKYTLKRVSTPTVTKYSSTKVKLTWGKITGSSGYQISRTTTLTGTSVVKTVSSSCVSTTLSTTRNKTYYYKVRSYATVGTKKIYGPWSYIKGYKLK